MPIPVAAAASFGQALGQSAASTGTTGLLYLIEILHQTTTCGKCEDCLRRCILSKFYIKPQPS